MDTGALNPLPTLSDLHPYCRALLARWEAARGDRFAPSWRALDLIQIAPPAALAHCSMVERTEDEPGFVYRFFGTWHAILHNRDLTGKPLTALRPANHAQRLQAEYAEVVAQRRPLAFRFDVPVLTGTRSQREVIRLPLSNNGTDVDAVVATAVFLEGEKEALTYFRAHQRNNS